jgi:3-oxoacyl-[acyl-carrier-protein] synthase II
MSASAHNTRGVVITGLGVVTAQGLGVEALWEGLLAGRTGIDRIQALNPGGFDCQYAAEVRDFKTKDFVPKKHRKSTKVMARDIELAVGAAMLAVRDADLVTRGTDPDATPTYPPPRCGAQIGAGIIAADANELTEALVKAADEEGHFSLKLWGKAGMSSLTPLWLLKYLPNMLACHVTIIHDCQGPSNTITCGEASSLLCIGESTRVIGRGDADLCFTGGAESKVNLLHLMRQQLLGKMAVTADGVDPAAIVRPYDADDSSPGGGVVGEGGGILIIEAKDTAAARGATPYAEIVGFGSSIAPHIDPESGALAGGPARDGRAVRWAIENALQDAGVSADQIDAIVPTGLGIRVWDRAEEQALQDVFGERLPTLPLVTTKPFVGNCGAGCGGVDLAVAALCLKHGRLPARLHGGTPQPGLDVGPAPARDAALDYVLVFSASECGECVAIVLKKC